MVFFLFYRIRRRFLPAAQRSKEREEVCKLERAETRPFALTLETPLVPSGLVWSGLVLSFGSGPSAVLLLIRTSYFFFSIRRFFPRAINLVAKTAANSIQTPLNGHKIGLYESSPSIA